MERKQLRLGLQRREKMLAALEAMKRMPEQYESLGWVVDHRIRHRTTELEWLDEVIMQLGTQVTQQLV